MLEKMRNEAHEKLDYSKYADTQIRNETNCYSHVLGLTTCPKKVCRIGAICGEKPITESYDSEEEIKELFIKDLEALSLQFEEIKVNPGTYKTSVISRVERYPLKENEHIALLWLVYNPDDSIRDYHWWRYDSRGFSDKRSTKYVSQVEMPEWSWPESWNTFLTGVYVIKR